MNLQHITKENFHRQVVSSEKPVLLSFLAPWCGPCSLFRPVLEELAGERQDIQVCTVNVDTEPELTSRFKVFQVPTLLVMQSGAEEDRFLGAREKHQLAALFD